ncbi:MAG: response regulator [Desulfobulbaceae bacterium]|nr:response regulator [Desulfobulbaceae bacterium]
MQEEKKIKVLLVDDEETFAKTLSERLTTRDLASEAVFGGTQALESIGADEPDVMVLDLKMPGMDGMEVLRRVKKNYPNIRTIILSGHGTDTDKKEAAELGVVDFLVKPAAINMLTEKIKVAFAAKSSPEMMYSYNDFVPILKKHLNNEGVTLGKNALGIKCFCRDDNQDHIGALLMSTGSSTGWFDLNAFGAFPAGRSLESLGPPSHHIPELLKDPWTVVLHATHVGCDSKFTLGMTDRYGMKKPSASCGLLAAILKRHNDRRNGIIPPVLRDFEMHETEKALLPHLDKIQETAYPMAAIAEKLQELGCDIFDALLKESGTKSIYIGGINVDYEAENPANNFFVPKKVFLYEGGIRRELAIN